MPRVTVLYENGRNQKTKEFGPHKLVRRCVADDLGRDLRLLGDHVLTGRPCAGNSNVRKLCREQLGLLAGRDGVVVAVYDRDKLGDLEPTANACTKGFVGALTQGCEPPDRLRCVLLERNLETVLEVLRDVRPDLLAPADWKEAIEDKNPTQRDRALGAASVERHLAVRAALRAKMPSFDYLIVKIAKELRAEGSPA